MQIHARIGVSRLTTINAACHPCRRTRDVAETNDFEKAISDTWLSKSVPLDRRVIMLYVVIVLIFALPIAWFASEFQRRVELRILSEPEPLLDDLPTVR